MKITTAVLAVLLAAPVLSAQTAKPAAKLSDGFAKAGLVAVRAVQHGSVRNAQAAIDNADAEAQAKPEAAIVTALNSVLHSAVMLSELTDYYHSEERALRELNRKGQAIDAGTCLDAIEARLRARSASPVSAVCKGKP